MPTRPNGNTLTDTRSGTGTGTTYTYTYNHANRLKTVTYAGNLKGTLSLALRMPTRHPRQSIHKDCSLHDPRAARQRVPRRARMSAIVLNMRKLMWVAKLS